MYVCNMVLWHQLFDTFVCEYTYIENAHMHARTEKNVTWSLDLCFQVPHFDVDIFIYINQDRAISDMSMNIQKVSRLLQSRI